MDSLVIYFGVLGTGIFFLSRGFLRKNGVFLSVVGFAIIVLMAAGRYNVGTDVNTYGNIFTRNAGLSWSQMISNVGESWLFYIIGRLTWPIGGRVLTWGVFALLSALPVYLALKDEYSDISFGVAFFVFVFQYYVTGFNITKQIVACAFVFYGMKYIFKNRIFSFLISIFIAMGFHITAFLAIPAWFFWNHRDNCIAEKNRRFLLIVAIAIVVFSYQIIIKKVANSISLLSEFADYAQTSSRGQNRDLYLYLAEYMLIFLFRSYFYKMDDRIQVMMELMLISVLVGITGFTHPQVKRIALYFAMPSRIILFGYLPHCFNDNSKMLARFLVILMFAAEFILTAYILGEAHLIPYRFSW